MINWIISILVCKGLISYEEGEHLAAKLVSTTHPSHFPDAHRIVESCLKEVESKKPKR